MIIEALTLLFVFSVVMVSMFTLLNVSLKYIQNSKNRLSALAVANERMEIVRNLNYNNIGTVGGEVSGNIPQDQVLTENGKNFSVHTLVEYVLDPFDGLYPPTDLAFEDYKKVTVTVSWGPAPLDSGVVELATRFVPPGLEIANPNDGILLINVFSSQTGGTGIPGANVHVVNAITGLDEEKDTDETGSAYFIGNTVKQSIQTYHITVTKDGYETVATLPPYPTTPYTPIDVHASVVTGTLNVTNIVQNQLADINVHTLDYLEQPLGTINFHLEGGRKLGTSPVSPYAVTYNFKHDDVTASNGLKAYPDVSPGTYTFTLLNPSLTNYEIISIDPVSPFILTSASGTLDANVKLASKTMTSLMVDVLHLTGGAPVDDASVQATNVSGYNQTIVTEKDGRAFFPVSSTPFVAGSYHLKITCTGFVAKDVDVTVTANQLKKTSVSLTSS